MKLKKSLLMQSKAKKIIPGMTQFLSKRPDLWSYGVWPTYFSKARGSNIWDLDGNKYIDMSVAGVGTNILGYADQDVNRAVINIIKEGSNSTLNSPEEIELSELLIKLHPWADMVRLCRTGAEAMSVAVRIARASQKKDRVAFCGYHGWSDWYVSANLKKNDILQKHVIPGIDPMGVPKKMGGSALAFTYNDINSLKKIISKNKKELAAVVMEPIRSIKPTNSFLEKVRNITKENNIPLIFDEITSAFRMKTEGAHQTISNVKPDIAVFSKAMGNGHPIAAIIGSEKIMRFAEQSFISSTFWTEKVGTIAALATLKKHKNKNVGKRLIQIGKEVRKIWKEKAEKENLKINIGGGMDPISSFSIECEYPQILKTFFIEKMLEKKFIANTLFYSMYSHTDKELKLYEHAVEETFNEISKNLKNKTLKKNIKGKPAISSFKRLA